MHPHRQAPGGILLLAADLTLHHMLLPQVHHRCPCSNATVCGEEEAVALKLAKEGKIKSSYILP